MHHITELGFLHSLLLRHYCNQCGLCDIVMMDTSKAHHAQPTVCNKVCQYTLIEQSEQ